MERSTTTCPCAADMPGAENMPVPGFRTDRRWGFSSERLGITFHGNTLTHVDSPCHIFWDGTMYNGRSHSLVDAATGSAWAAVTAAANGIITRGDPGQPGPGYAVRSGFTPPCCRVDGCNRGARQPAARPPRTVRLAGTSGSPVNPIALDQGCDARPARLAWARDPDHNHA